MSSHVLKPLVCLTAEKKFTLSLNTILILIAKNSKQNYLQVTIYLRVLKSPYIEDIRRAVEKRLCHDYILSGHPQSS